MPALAQIFFLACHGIPRERQDLASNRLNFGYWIPPDARFNRTERHLPRARPSPAAVLCRRRCLLARPDGPRRHPPGAAIGVASNSPTTATHRSSTRRRSGPRAAAPLRAALAWDHRRAKRKACVFQSPTLFDAVFELDGLASSAPPLVKGGREPILIGCSCVRGRSVRPLRTNSNRYVCGFRGNVPLAAGLNDLRGPGAIYSRDGNPAYIPPIACGVPRWPTDIREILPIG